MAKVTQSLMEYSGTMGRVIHYKRFGKTYTRQLPAQYNDRKSEAQLRWRAVFKARQHASALFAPILQRGLTKAAHAEGMTEANLFSRINKNCFSFENGTVLVDYPSLLLAKGPLPKINIDRRKVTGLHVELKLFPLTGAPKARQSDVLHVYAVAPEANLCELVASSKRRINRIAFDLPDLSDESRLPMTYHLYALAEADSTAAIPTLSPAEKKADKQHRNINRRVSQSVYLGAVTYPGK